VDTLPFAVPFPDFFETAVRWNSGGHDRLRSLFGALHGEHDHVRRHTLGQHRRHHIGNRCAHPASAFECGGGLSGVTVTRQFLLMT
jgi:hypothetical protein